MGRVLLAIAPTPATLCSCRLSMSTVSPRLSVGTRQAEGALGPSASAEPAILKVLPGRTGSRLPLWMMRQAGRYLPEYRTLREKAGSFLDLCFNPDLAAEVTLQPVRRFGFDAAILFSDILLVPHALGQQVSFAVGEGPQLTPTIGPDGLGALADKIDLGALASVFETIRVVRAKLPHDVALLGFCGAPWTAAVHMVAGCGTSSDRAGGFAAQ